MGHEAVPLFHNQDDMKEEDDLWKWLLDLSRVPSEVRPQRSDWGVFEIAWVFRTKFGEKTVAYVNNMVEKVKIRSREKGKIIFKISMVKRWSMNFSEDGKSQGRLTRKPGSFRANPSSFAPVPARL